MAVDVSKVARETDAIVGFCKKDNGTVPRAHCWFDDPVAQEILDMVYDE